MKGFKQKDLKKNKKIQKLQKPKTRKLLQKPSKACKTSETEKILKICQQKNSFLIFEKLQKILTNTKHPKSQINQKDESGKTALMYCVQKNDLESVRLLLDFGADVNIRDNLGENCVFYILKCENFDFDILEELLKKNVFLGFLNKFLENVFLKSLKIRNLEVVRYLLVFEMDFFVKDIFGFNCVDMIFILQNRFLIGYLKLKFCEQRFNSFLSYYTEEKIVFLKNNFEKINSEYKIIESKKNCAAKKKKFKLNPNSSNFSPKFIKSKKNQFIEKPQLSEKKNKSKKTKILKKPKIFKETKISEKQNSEKKQQIQKKKSEIENYILKIKLLEKKNTEIKKKLNQKKLKNSQKSQFFKKRKNFCFFKSQKKKNKSQNHNYPILYEKTTQKINTYINWLEQYKKFSIPLFKQIEKLIKKKIKNNFQEISLETSGSYSIDLLMPWSDLNIIVSFDQKFYDFNQENLFHKKIKKFVKKLKTSKIIKNLIYEERSNLDIIKIEMSKQFQNKKVEIIFKHFINNNYPTNEKIIKNFISKYPISKPLYIIFRKILHTQKLDDPSKFGLRTICIYFLIIGFLQNLKYPVSENGKIDENEKNRIGELFVNFIYFFSYNFDFNREMINPFFLEGDFSAKKSICFKDFKNKMKSLTILNPYKNSIILTKSFRRTEELKSLFRFVYVSFFQFCSCSERNKIVLKQKNEESFLKGYDKNIEFDFLEGKNEVFFNKSLKEKNCEGFLEKKNNDYFLNKKNDDFLSKKNDNNFLEQKKDFNYLHQKNNDKFLNKNLDKTNNSFFNKKNDIEEKDTTTPESVLFKFQQIIIKYKNMISEKKKIKFIKLGHEVEFFNENKLDLFSEENLLSEKSSLKSYDFEFSINRIFNFNMCEPLIYN